MRIYSSLIEAYDEITRDLFEVGEWIQGHSVQDQIVEGDKAFDFMELSPYVYMLTDTPDTDRFIESLELNRPWLDAEFEERLVGDFNPGKAWKLRREVWAPFLEWMGRFAYTYSERLHSQDQFERVIRELARYPASRQCVVTVYQMPKDILSLGGRHRIPCSMFYQFMIRQKKLTLHYVMRSCDLFLHFPYDQLLAIQLQQYVAKKVGVPVGPFVHMITSLHGFRKDFPEGVF